MYVLILYVDKVFSTTYFVTRIIEQDNCWLMLVEYKNTVEQYSYLVPREDSSPHKKL